MTKPPVEISLEWVDDFRFQAKAGEVVTPVDGDGRLGPSPMQLLLQSLASCTGSDVVDILRKGRREPVGLAVTAAGERRQEAPHRYVRIRLEYRIEGDVDRPRAERAVALSLEKYCSVYHTLREDLELEWAVVLEPRP